MRHLPATLLFLLLLPSMISPAEVINYVGASTALPHDQYVHAVSEAVSPVEPVYIKARDGVYVAAAIRRPEGDGPFPALILFHGAPGGRGMEQLIGWSRGDHGGPVWERFLKEGYVVVVADYRGGDWNLMNQPSSSGLVTAIDDGLTVIDFVRALPEVDGERISLYGVSLGGNLVLYLASAVPTLHAVVAGAPAPIWFLGSKIPTDGSRPDFSSLQPDTEVSSRNIASIETPILIQVGTADSLLPLDQLLHDALIAQGKKVRMEVYEHGYHDFVLGPQGHDRRDLPQGEILMQGTLDALERSVRFIKTLE